MRRHGWAAVLLVAGCSNIGAPLITSDQVYEFRDTDTATPLVFNWPRSTLPVRIWVESGGPLAAPMQTAIDRWQSAFLYGEFRATVVADSSSADVIVRNEPPDIVTAINGRAPQCDGVTSGIDPDAQTVDLPMHVFIYPVVAPDDAALATCYRITATHELGHVLGIINFAHAGATAADVMYKDPVLDGLSDRDRLTATTLYLLTPNVSISGRR
jgi:predicted Zn-dependent protease